MKNPAFAKFNLNLFFFRRVPFGSPFPRRWFLLPSGGFKQFDFKGTQNLVRTYHSWAQIQYEWAWKKLLGDPFLPTSPTHWSEPGNKKTGESQWLWRLLWRENPQGSHLVFRICLFDAMPEKKKNIISALYSGDKIVMNPMVQSLKKSPTKTHQSTSLVCYPAGRGSFCSLRTQTHTHTHSYLIETPWNLGASLISWV